MLYAIWTCELQATFRFNDRLIFTLKYDNKGHLSSADILDTLSRANNGLTPTKLNNNTMTFSFAQTDYYLQGYRYGAAIYTLAELCELTFTANVDITLELTNIYSIVYTAGSLPGIVEELEYEYTEYIVESGTSTGYAKIVAAGLETRMELPALPTDIGSYLNNEMTGWKWEGSDTTLVWSTATSMSSFLNICLVTNVLDTLFGPKASDVIFQLPRPITKVFLFLSSPNISTNSSFK